MRVKLAMKSFGEGQSWGGVLRRGGKCSGAMFLNEAKR